MDDTRLRLLNSAGVTFAERGFESATIRDICARAGANIAAVNYHFGDKERLYVATLQLAACESGSPPHFEWPSGTPPEDKMQGILRHFITLMLDKNRPEWHLKLMMQEMITPSNACVELVENYIRAIFSQAVEVVRELLPDQTPQRDIHLMTFSIVSQCLHYRYHQVISRILIGTDDYNELLNLDLLVKHIFQFSIAGIRGYVARTTESLR
ncbi:CerR family C-terminal domain-containing protein [Planctomicrobium sp. SH668]|uniref:CerR family C-terminal domain-containing protein n=1 Tax=Planctomicrobium sp. SH668 TaxID=3448126 RepID=UPI003F5C37A6